MVENFGAALKRLRVARGLRLRDLAKRAGVDPSYVSRIEHGERLPPSRRVVAGFVVALGLIPGSAASDALFLAADYLPPDVDPAVMLAAYRAIRADGGQRATAAPGPRQEAG